MRLQRDDDVVLHTELGGIVGAARMHGVLLLAREQRQAALAHRGKVRAACDEADVGARARELNPEISADCAGAVDADLHGILAKQRKPDFGTKDPVRLGRSEPGMVVAGGSETL
ncbi:hypothetical protein ACVWZ6_004244 [Bradyrhizobium sp. GM6.1]